MPEKNPVDELRQRMKAKATTEAGAKPVSDPPQGGGTMGTDKDGDVRGEGSKDKDVAAGPKSLHEKTKVAEDVIATAKARDVEDTREETSGDERHDLVIGKELNIPPTIMQERLRLGQNPATGEPWSKDERMRYDREQEQSRQAHAKAVRESEIRMRDEKLEADRNRTNNQPVSHVPVNQLTADQLKAMQEAQDAGKGPAAQAAARDAAGPDERGRREAEMAADRHRTDRENAGVDEDLEKKELGEDTDTDDETDEGDKDPDQIEAELDRKSEK